MNSPKPLTVEQHRQLQLLLPWYFNQSLEDDERQALEIHLQSCLQCSRELLELRNIAVAVNRASDLEAAADISFAKLRTKLPSRLPNQFGEGATHQSKHTGYWLRSVFVKNYPKIKYVVLAVFLLVLLPLTILSYKLVPANDYYTLSANMPTSLGLGKLYVVFAKSTTNKEIDEQLAQIHARRIAGPNSVGAYTIQVDDVDDSRKIAQIIVYLRQQPSVVLVEPIKQP
jgi:hypothetical protein